jgi:hypothetical protein
VYRVKSAFIVPRLNNKYFQAGAEIPAGVLTEAEAKWAIDRALLEPIAKVKPAPVEDTQPEIIKSEATESGATKPQTAKPKTTRPRAKSELKPRTKKAR